MTQSVLNIGGPIRVTLPEPAKVTAVKVLIASAEAHGYELERKPGKLEAKWVKWAKDVRKRR